MTSDLTITFTPLDDGTMIVTVRRNGLVQRRQQCLDIEEAVRSAAEAIREWRKGE